MQKIFERATWKEDWMVAKNVKWKQDDLLHGISPPLSAGGTTFSPKFWKVRHQ